MASILYPHVFWGLVASLLFGGPSVASPFISVALLPVAGSLVAKLGRGVLIFLLGDSAVVMATDCSFMFLWEVLLLSALVALGLVACNVVAELDCDLLLVVSKAMVGMSGNLVPVFSGYIFILIFLVSVALMSVAGAVMVVFI